MKIRPVGAELFHEDRHGEANSRFPKILRKCNSIYSHTEKVREALVKSMHYVMEYIFCVLRINADFVLRKAENEFSYRGSLVYLVHILVATQAMWREGASDPTPPVGFHTVLINILLLIRCLYNVMPPYYEHKCLLAPIVIILP